MQCIQFMRDTLNVFDIVEHFILCYAVRGHVKQGTGARPRFTAGGQTQLHLFLPTVSL